MLIRRRTLRRLFTHSLLSLLFGSSAFSQNLLVNPGFDRDLSGWTVATTISPDPSPSPGYVEASAAWVPTDRSASAASGGLAIHAVAYWTSAATAYASQCVPVAEGQVFSYGTSFLTSRQRLYAGGEATLKFFPTSACSGTPSAQWAVSSLGSIIDGQDHGSNGLWLPASGAAIAPEGTRSALFGVGGRATGFMSYAPAWVDAVADDAYLLPSTGVLTTTILPSAAWLARAGVGWRTGLTLVNPGSSDAAVTLKFLGHDRDGRDGAAYTYLVRAGRTLTNVEADFEANLSDYGAVLMTATSPSVFLQSETSTFVEIGGRLGSVGQALPALSAPDFATATPKTLAPVRNDDSFRTNLVLANPTEIPVLALVAILDEGGNHLEDQEVGLPALGMTQISGAALGTHARSARALRVSTRTPGGQVAAYASIIDNTSNDPRVVLPRDVAAGARTSNLISNPGFDHDLSGWSVSTRVAGRASWASADVSGSASSGSLELDAQGNDSVSASQCVPVDAFRLATAGARIRTDAQMGFAKSGLTVTLFDVPGCVGMGSDPADVPELPRTSPVPIDSGGVWRSLALQIFTRNAKSALVEISANGSYSAGPPTRDHVFADDVFLDVAPVVPASLLPSAAWLHTASGAFWRTRVSLTNPFPTFAFVTLEFAGHDDTESSSRLELDVPAYGTLSVLPNEPPNTSFSERWGAIRIASSSPVLVQSETSTPTAAGGTVGQALPAFSENDFAKVSPKSLAPIRENASFRTNLVLANPTEIPVTAHVVLFAADGTPLGTRDVALPPLGMTQINGVASALGAATLDAGRLAISTSTPGGAVAAYASVIDNVTNDPRTLLPR